MTGAGTATAAHTSDTSRVALHKRLSHLQCGHLCTSQSQPADTGGPAPTIGVPDYTSLLDAQLVKNADNSVSYLIGSVHFPAMIQQQLGLSHDSRNNCLPLDDLTTARLVGSRSQLTRHTASRATRA